MEKLDRRCLSRIDFSSDSGKNFRDRLSWRKDRVGKEYNPDCLVCMFKSGGGNIHVRDAWRLVALERSTL